ncbi:MULTISPECIES: aminoglycoside phosphotransferase family protein [unclassified Paenibacillus]|uniref:phosphotransferase family protein n=1 Tax=unclassified Paenibacillus TaxID=185978 RepID=UPI0009549A83|nr:MULTISPECIES: aminoglycoside phosphotransferase family protein [unclassified Paenibacillus]ASS66573.1 aminoglycoside phosphotransferase family protein [Paenibacillus sp. RUD330]SIQ02080.1 Phosphotransferase enzyme family protein [Paenibacillus sp. RU4X]SIQ21487.1 Phosphotransferase enzyme family protein [Paenibacillus sp. RU4T]
MKKIGELLGKGNTADVYRWGRTEVVKILHQREHSGHEAEKEARNAEAVQALGLKTPAFGGLVEIEGKTCLIYERIDGPTMLNRIEMTDSSVIRYARLMAQLQFEIHQAEVPFDPNLKRELSHQIQTAPLLNEAEKQAVLSRVKNLPEGNKLCHYDFHPGNIILSANGPVIIDWINALVGNEEADIARTSMMLLSHAVPPDAPGWLLGVLRKLFHDEYMKEYLLLSGMGRKAVEEWMAPALAARIGEVGSMERNEIVHCLREILKEY